MYLYLNVMEKLYRFGYSNAGSDTVVLGGVVKMYLKKDKDKALPEVEESIYDKETRERRVEEGALSNEEDGFMLGYEEGFQDSFEDEDALWWEEDLAE